MSDCDKGAAPTEVNIMWTNQHGTGPLTDDRVETQVILQYMCQPFTKEKVTDINADFDYHTIRNGGNIQIQPFNPRTKESSLIKKDRGLHEPKEYYHAYLRRGRNTGKIWIFYIASESQKSNFCPLVLSNPLQISRLEVSPLTMIFTVLDAFHSVIPIQFLQTNLSNSQSPCNSRLGNLRPESVLLLRFNLPFELS